jgi:acylphosphatase
MKQVRIIVSGRVQGVYFRASARDYARQLGLKGWVRNCSDGSVEALAEGQQTQLQQFITWCHSGPPGALVTDVAVEWQAASAEWVDFVVRY